MYQWKLFIIGSPFVFLIELYFSIPLFFFLSFFLSSAILLKNVFLSFRLDFATTDKFTAAFAVLMSVC